MDLFRNFIDEKFKILLKFEIHSLSKVNLILIYQILRYKVENELYILKLYQISDRNKIMSYEKNILFFIRQNCHRHFQTLFLFEEKCLPLN